MTPATKHTKPYIKIVLILNTLIILNLILTGCYSALSDQPVSASQTKVIPKTSESKKNILIPERSVSVNTEAFLTIDCTSTIQDSGEIMIDIQIKNISQSNLYVFDSDRMPYLLQQDDDSLLILYGVNPPDPLKNYFTIEIPITKRIQPGEIVTEEMSLTPLYFGHHYGLHRYRSTPKQRHGPTTIHCQVGWGHTPILSHKEEKDVRNINHLMDWQQLTTAKPIEVDFP